MERNAYLVKIKQWQSDPATGSGCSPEMSHYFCYAQDETDALATARKIHYKPDHINHQEFTVKKLTDEGGVYRL